MSTEPSLARTTFVPSVRELSQYDTIQQEEQFFQDIDNK